MISYQKKMREIAKKLLENKTVDCFVGYKAGTIPLTAAPTVIKDASQVDELVWNSNCAMNLTNFITKRTGKIGVLATGCNSRNMVLHINENQVKRDNLYVVGVPCTGMVDPKQVKKLVDGEILEANEDDDTITVKGHGFEKTINIVDVLQNNCRTCIKRNPVLSDELVADEVPELENVDTYADVAELENLSDEERWAKFQDAFSSCVRCYACRNACPECYCPTCFVDESKPQWVGKSVDPIDTATFQFLRSFHLAGRCTDCGACERACPVGIPVRYLTKKLNKDVKDIYKYDAGIAEGQKNLLDDYKLDDLNDFVR